MSLDTDGALTELFQTIQCQLVIWAVPLMDLAQRERVLIETASGGKPFEGIQMTRKESTDSEWDSSLN